MAELDSKLEECVEMLCHHGCDAVSSYIDALRAGQVFAEVAGLTVAERQRVLDELVSIMMPYEGKDKG
jgi:hypothetical protein